MQRNLPRTDALNNRQPPHRYTVEAFESRVSLKKRSTIWGIARRVPAFLFFFGIVFIGIAVALRNEGWDRDFFLFFVPLDAYLALLAVTNLEAPDWKTTWLQVAAGLLTGCAWGLSGGMGWEMALASAGGLAVIAPFSNRWIWGVG